MVSYENDTRKTVHHFMSIYLQMRSLEERVEEQRKEQNRKMQALMKELDEERKRRACMEVEVERLRKLVDAYAQV